MRVLYLLFLFIFFSQFCMSDILRIIDYNSNIVFNNLPVVKITKGDNIEFLNLEYDDSSWITISLPSKWESIKGFERYKDICWYRIKIIFPPELPSKSIGISLGEIFDADETYFNGILIGKTGTITIPFRENAFEKDRIYEIPTTLIKTNTTNIVAIRVKGIFGTSGPQKGNFIIGTYDNLIKKFYINEFLKLMFVPIYLFLSLYYLLFFIKRTKNIEYLFFSIFCILLSIYIFMRSELRYELTNDFNLLKKIELTSMILIFPVFLSFILNFFNEKITILHKAYYYLCGLFCFISIIINNAEMRYFFNSKIIQPSMIIPLVLIVTVFIKNFKKEKSARIMVYSFIAIIITLFIDVLSARNIIDFPPLIPYGILIFVMSLAFILANDFVKINKKLEELNQNLEKKVLERTRELKNALKDLEEREKQIEKELKMAGEVQRSLLPAIESNEFLKFKVIYEPFRDVSGDLYEIINIENNKTIVFFANVSGHGLPAALITILVKRIFSKIISDNILEPYEILNILNNQICDQLMSGQHLTAFIAYFDSYNNRLVFSNANNPPAVLISENDRMIKLINTEGNSIGLSKNNVYKQKTENWKYKDKLIIFTHSLIESFNSKKEQYGMDRLLNVIQKNINNNIEITINEINIDFKKFILNEKIKDDLTIIGIESIQ